VDQRVNPGEDLYLAMAIEESIGGDERTTELGVRVRVHAGRVVLRGTVASPSRRDAAAAVAAEHAPTHRIVNEIRVVDPGVSQHGEEPTEEKLA
jgi:osmotically-inducible protein OsmY